MAGIAACDRLCSPVSVQILSGSHFCPQSIDGLSRLIGECLKNAKICQVTESELELGTKETRQLLVIPGAPSTQQWDLREDQQTQIHALCSSGDLRVICVCAGAYFASRQVVYEEKIKKPGCLQLFQGTCKGPFLQGIQIGEMQIKGSKVPVCFNLGGTFLPDPSLEEGKDYVELGRYPDNSLAALACQPQKDGTYGAILLGPHLEYTQEHFQSLSRADPSHEKQLLDMGRVMEQSSNERCLVMRKFLGQLGFN